jgi:hypothetical protein
MRLFHESPRLEKYPRMLAKYLESLSGHDAHPNVEDIIRRHYLPQSAPMCHSANFSLIRAVAVFPSNSSEYDDRVDSGVASN